jgi:hypothetical protein
MVIMSKALRSGLQGLVGLAGGLGALLLGMSTAGAVAPVTLQLAPGMGGPYNYEDPEEGIKNGGPGHEQAVVSAIEVDGKQFIVVAYISSNVPDNLAPYQAKCSSFELTENGPVMVADQVYLTENENTDRSGMKPALQWDGKNLLFGYGYAPNGGNTRTYVRLINERCQSISDTVKVSNNDNQNIGAPHISNIGQNKFFVSYYSNNGNEARGRFVTIENGAIVKANNINLLNPSNIGRTPVATSGDRVLACTPRGNNRPSEIGASCTYLNATTGEILWKNQTIAASDPENESYFTQVSLVNIGTGRFAMMTQESTGTGKNTNDKASNTSHIFIMEPTDDAPGVKAHTMGDAIYATHAALVTGGYSETGETALGLFEAPPTPSGVAAVSFLKYDPQALSFKPLDMVNDQWIVSPLNADSGKLSNLYGQNPQTQGRNYLHGVGDIKNPGFGKGFMKEAETLFAMAYTGKSPNPDEPKLAAFITLMPGKTATPVTPSNPEAPPPEQFNPNGVKPAEPGANGNVDQPAPGTPNANEPDTDTQVAPQSAGACAFSAEPTTGGSLAALGFAIMGLAASRRRNRKES